jgi:UDP-glucose 6-dehydrogenase
MQPIVIAALGLAFKANTDDTRNSPAIRIIQKLQKLGFRLKAYDPSGVAVDGIQNHSSAQEAISNSDLVLILTEWDEFKELNPKNCEKLMRTKAIFDTRQILNQVDWRAYNFHFL